MARSVISATDTVMVDVGVPVTQWESPRATVAGNVVLFRNMHGGPIEEFEGKFYLVHKRVGDVIYSYYTVLPLDPKVLGQFLREVAEHNNIQL